MPCHQRPTTSGSCSTAVTCARGSSRRLRNDQSLSRPSTENTTLSPSVVTSTIPGLRARPPHFAHLLFCWHALLQLFLPVQHHVKTLGACRAFHHQEMLTIGCDVIVGNGQRGTECVLLFKEQLRGR